MASRLMMHTQTCISVFRPSFAWLPGTLLRYRNYSNYRATPELIPAELARSPAHHTSTDMLPKPARTEARLARIHAVVIRFLHPPNSPPQVSVDQRERTSQLPSYENPDHLPLRSHEDYIHDGEATLADPNRLHTLGIKGVSPFTLLPTISFPASIPFDIMHLVFLNFVRDLCALFNGSYFKDQPLNKHVASLSNSEWTAFGADMAKIESPTSWGRPPRDISKYIGSFKAEDLYNFLMYYMLPLIHRRVPHNTFKALRRLVMLITMAASIEIRYTDMDVMETQLTLFVKWFYDAFYQNDHERLPICKYTEHCLVHIVRDIRNWGSACYYWQFPEVLSSVAA
jgi:hypothetical protein